MFALNSQHSKRQRHYLSIIHPINTYQLKLSIVIQTTSQNRLIFTKEKTNNIHKRPLDLRLREDVHKTKFMLDHMESIGWIEEVIFYI